MGGNQFDHWRGKHHDRGTGKCIHHGNSNRNRWHRRTKRGNRWDRHYNRRGSNQLGPIPTFRKLGGGSISFRRRLLFDRTLVSETTATAHVERNATEADAARNQLGGHRDAQCPTFSQSGRESPAQRSDQSTGHQQI